jgi:hypothetical protein
MAGLAAAAGIIGITNVAIQSIKSLYDVVQSYRDVPSELERFRCELASLQGNLNGLQFLQQADEQTRAEVKETGVGQAINSCCEACDQFKLKLATWIKHGQDSFRDKVRILRNRKSIDKYSIKIWTTARLLDSAVGILNLSVQRSQRSEHR